MAIAMDEKLFELATVTIFSDGSYHFDITHQEGFLEFCKNLGRDKKEGVDICPECGFDKNLPREPVIMDCNPLSLASYFKGKCGTCGCQSDGSTILENPTDKK